MAITKDDILEAVGQMSVMDLNDLVKAFEEKFGVSAAKVLNDFAKGNDKLVIKAGNYAGNALDKAAVTALANIPSREVLISQLLGVMQAPVSGMARVLAAVAAKKEAEAA